MKNYSPLRYPGGKTQLYQYIKELVKINEATTYIEPFMGGMGVAIKLLINNEVEKIMVNDYDKAIYAFWYSVLHYPEELIALIKTTPITIEEWQKQRDIQRDKDNCTDLLQLGFSTLFLNRTNRSGILKAGVMGGVKQNGNYKLDCRFNKDKIIEKVKLISSLKSKIKLYNMDAEEFIKLNITKTKNSLTFFDPPYFVKGSSLYPSFYKKENHIDLSNTIKKHLKNKKWILTYDVIPDIYELYNEFRNKKYYLNYSVSKPNKGVEYMFYSNEIIIPDKTDNLKEALINDK